MALSPAYAQFWSASPPRAPDTPMPPKNDPPPSPMNQGKLRSPLRDLPGCVSGGYIISVEARFGVAANRVYPKGFKVL